MCKYIYSGNRIILSKQKLFDNFIAKYFKKEIKKPNKVIRSQD